MASGTRVEASRKQTNAQSVWGDCGFTVCLCRRKCRSSWFRHWPWMENINASSPHALAPQFAVYSTGRFQGICSWSESLSPPPSLPPLRSSRQKIFFGVRQKSRFSFLAQGRVANVRRHVNNSGERSEMWGACCPPRAYDPRSVRVSAVGESLQNNA